MTFIIRLAKNSVLALLCLGVASVSCSGALEQEQPIEQQSLTEETRALQLNLLLEKNLQQLDELNSVLQYLGQAISKGTIKLAQKTDALEWSAAHQTAIRKLTNSCSYPIDESQLHTLSSSTKLLALHVSSTVDSHFSSLPVLALDDLTLTRAHTFTSLQSLEKLALSNDMLIAELKYKADRSGLTKVNMITRKLDAINDKLHLTTSFKYIPLATVTAATAIHFMPERWFAKSGILKDIKSFVGTSFLDKPNNNATSQPILRRSHSVPDLPSAPLLNHRRLLLQPHQIKSKRGIIGTLADIIKHDDTKNLGKVLLGVGAWTFSKISLPGALEDVSNDLQEKIRDKWEQLKGYDSSSAKKQYDYTIKMTLDDEKLVGLESQIAELRKLVQYITSPEIYDRSNANLEKGLLLVGPSRSGKTYAARALHGSINKALAEKNIPAKFGFRELKWTDIVYTKDGVQKILDEAKKNAPCVLFIDEIHNLPLQTKEYSGVLTQFLTGMSGINSESDAKHQVILLGATNHPEMLDFALLQPGRFGTIIHFEKPSYENRKKYFEVIFKHNAIDTEALSLDALARQTEDCSYGNLEFIVKQARFVARTQAKGVTQKHLQDQVNTHVRSFKTLLPLTSQEKKMLAVHQAGHALTSILLDAQDKIESVTILPRHRKIIEKRVWTENPLDKNKCQTTKYGGLFTYNSSEALKSQDAQEKRKQCMIRLAGPLAEKLVLGKTGSSHHTKDRRKALSYAQEIQLDGLTLEDLPKQAQQEVKQQAYALLQKLEQDTQELLSSHKSSLETLAQALENQHTLTAEDLKSLLQSS